MMKLILKCFMSPGDIVSMTAAVRDLHLAHPGKFITDVRTSASDIWIGNRYITPLDEKEDDVGVLEPSEWYPLINQSNQGPFRNICGFTDGLERVLKIRIPPTLFKGHIEITPEEQLWSNPVYDHVPEGTPYWIINAGHKSDFTAKMWDWDRYQKIVKEMPQVTFVQVGAKPGESGGLVHTHKYLEGDNVINMVGKTSIREMILITYHAWGVISPVSFPHILAYTVPPHPRYKRKSRAAVIIAGGREPNHWQQGPNQQHLHTCGMLSCCDYGGCWKSRVVPIGDGDPKDDPENDQLCYRPTKTKSGQDIATCMDMIKAEDVIRLIKMYNQGLEEDLGRVLFASPKRRSKK